MNKNINRIILGFVSLLMIVSCKNISSSNLENSNENSSDINGTSSSTSLNSSSEEEIPPKTEDWELVEIPGYALGLDDTSSLEEIQTTKIRFHYSRKDRIYTEWALWCWDFSNNAGGAAYQFTHYDEFGVWGDVELSKVAPEGKNCSEMGFIVALDPGGTWAGKDYEADRFVKINEKSPGGIQHVYLVSGEEKQYLNKEDTRKHSLSTATVTDFNKVKMYFNLVDNKPFEFDINNVTIRQGTTKFTGLVAKKFNNNVGSVEIELPNDIDLTKDMDVQYRFDAERKDIIKPVFTALFNSQAFEERYTYTGDDLGVTFDKEVNPTSTTFKVWAPTSSKLVLNIFDDGDPTKQYSPVQTYQMVKGEKGVFEYTINENLHGKYYTYTVTNSNGTHEVVDPYAKSAGINGIRGMIVDFNKINSEIPGWNEDVRPNFGDNGTDASIYEIHVRDMTIDPDSGVSKEKRGLFSGLAEKGTSYTNENNVTVSTGLDHLKELGITHVQILPFYDYNSVEERKVSNDMSLEVENSNYNWGYDPLNYNVLEGSYSSNPYDGLVRIKEFKEMVMAMHSYGINIIMDVVYNHTAKTNDSNFEYLVPGYYHRRTTFGEVYNGSGCGNEMASDRSMVNKFVVDSSKFWLDEYHLGGYRFDLMGLLDNQAMIDIYKECTSIYSKAMIYGEPWTGGTSKLEGGTSESNLKGQKTVQDSLGQSYFAGSGVYVGAFNDQIRNGIRGDNNPSKGWLTGMTGNSGVIYAGISGLFSKKTEENRKVEPQQVINYVSCHDNYTLHDQLKLTTKLLSKEEFAKVYKQAETMVFTSQGVPFMQEGEDFMRTKVNKRNDNNTYDHNSYNTCDLTNHMDWSLKAENIEMFEYFKELIAFRKAHPEFTLSTREEVNNYVTQKGIMSDTLAYTFDLSSKGGDCYYIIHALYEGTHKLDGDYEIVFSNTNRVIDGTSINSIELEKNESIILKRK